MMEHNEHTAPGDCTAIEQRRNSDMEMEAVELHHPCPFNFKPTGNQPGDGSQHAGFKASEPGKDRSRHSAPDPAGSKSKFSNSDRRNHFDRRRIWSAHKQESFDLPEELQGQTEDSVFSDGSRPDRLVLQRSVSMPAVLPDVVPGGNLSFGNASPDVLFSMDKGNCSPSGVKSISSCSSLVSSGKVLEELEKKKNFEGSVCYDPLVPSQVKRKKSVTFERTVSDKGLLARSHFRSSGYGSQSDGSQLSQASNQSSEQGSVMSDDVLEEKRSLEDCSSSCVGDSYPRTDGSIDDAKEEDPKGETQAQGSHDFVHSAEQSGCTASAPEEMHSGPNSTQTPEELVDETELWFKQHSPKIHYSGMDPADLPNLSIFETEEEVSCSSVCLTGVAGDDLSNLRKQGKYDDGGSGNDIPLPSEQSFCPKSFEQSAGVVGARSGTEVANTENSENKTSPTTKEDCQRELYKRLFEEKMVKFDPSKENILDLLEWFKNNFGEALTPSPKSPFFQAGSPQSQNCMVPEALANTWLGSGLAGNPDTDRLGVPVPAATVKPALPVYNIQGGGHLVPQLPGFHDGQLNQQAVHYQMGWAKQQVDNHQGGQVYQQSNIYQADQANQRIFNHQSQAINLLAQQINWQQIHMGGHVNQQATVHQGGHRNQPIISHQRDLIAQQVKHQGGQMAQLTSNYSQGQAAWHAAYNFQGGQLAQLDRACQAGPRFQNLVRGEPGPCLHSVDRSHPVLPPALAPPATCAGGTLGGTPAVLSDQQRGAALPMMAPPYSARPGSALSQRAPLDEPALLSESSSVGLSSSLSTGVGDSHVEQLVNLLQCCHSRCTDYDCVQSKKCMGSLKKALKVGPNDLDADDIDLVRLLHEHFISCELPNCHVPWCRCLCLIHQSQGDRKRTQQELVTLLSNPLHTLLPPGVRFDKFVKLDSSLPCRDMPREWEEWLILYPLSDTYTVAKAVPLIDIYPRNHWVVKMTSLPEEKNQLDLLEKLRDLKHLHIINHIWMAWSSSSSLLVVCTDFLPGVSVRDLLDQRVFLGHAQVYDYLIQILTAVKHLHSLSIVYLNWTCTNLLLDQDCRSVRISNFTTSVDMSSDSADIGTVKLSLPADIVPTELLVHGGELTQNSDSWGVGCVLYEMLTGARPWYHLRHCRKEDTWKQILSQVPPELSGDLLECPRLLIQTCLQKSPNLRLSVGQMIDRVHTEMC